MIIDEFYYHHKATIYKWLHNFCIFIRLWAFQAIIIAEFQLNMFDLGVSRNPIYLDEPEGNSSSLKSKLEEARNKAIIQEAEFTNDPLELCLAVAKTCIEGDIPTKNRVLNKTIIKYFQEKIEMKISHEYF